MGQSARLRSCSSVRLGYVYPPWRKRPVRAACRSAVSFSFGFLVAVCRIRSAACDTRARPCVRCVLWRRGFPLVPALPSFDSAGTEVPLFAALIGTMAESDCFNPFIIDSDSLLSSAAPVRLPGRVEALSGPLRGRTCVPWVRCFQKVPSGITVQSAPIQRARTFWPCSRNWLCGPTYR